MRTYILDKSIVFLVGVGIFIAIPLLFDPIYSIVLRAVTAIAWLYWCKDLLLLPIDLLLGKTVQAYRFEGCLTVDQYESFRKKYWCVWRFNNGGKRLTLNVPLSCSQEETFKRMPSVGQTLTIAYCRLSGLLCSWEEA